MRSIVLVVLVALAVPAFAQEQSVLVSPAPASSPVGYVSAQDHAQALACSGGFEHCRRRGGYYEGIGFSTVSPSAAVRRSCYWGVRKPREVGTAYCPQRRGWIAVVRYY